MIDAGKFAKLTPPKLGEKGFFRFSIDREGAAFELRRVADAIEQNIVILQKVQSGVVADRTDYCLSALMIEFAQRETVEQIECDYPTAGKSIELYETHLFPIDVQSIPDL
jgi:hypothetical protein